MGQHKTNPVALAAKRGEIRPKVKPIAAPKNPALREKDQRFSDAWAAFRKRVPFKAA